MGPKNSSVDSPLMVAKMTIPATAKVRYRKMRLAGSGAVNSGRMNFKNRYRPTTRTTPWASTPPLSRRTPTFFRSTSPLSNRPPFMSSTLPSAERYRAWASATAAAVGCRISDGLTVIGSPLICCRNAITERISLLDSPIGFLLMCGILAGYCFGGPSCR